MVTRKLSGVNDMNYSYYIDRGKIFEVKKDEEKIPADMWGDSIKFLIENQKDYDVLIPISQRKLDWLKKEHPEWLI